MCNAGHNCCPFENFRPFYLTSVRRYVVGIRQVSLLNRGRVDAVAIFAGRVLLWVIGGLGGPVAFRDRRGCRLAMTVTPPGTVLR